LQSQTVSREKLQKSLSYEKKTAWKMLVKMTPGVNFINFLHKAFTRADPKSAKKTYSLTVPLCFGDLHVYKLLVEHW